MGALAVAASTEAAAFTISIASTRLAERWCTARRSNSAPSAMVATSPSAAPPDARDTAESGSGMDGVRRERGSGGARRARAAASCPSPGNERASTHRGSARNLAWAPPTQGTLSEDPFGDSRLCSIWRLAIWRLAGALASAPRDLPRERVRVPLLARGRAPAHSWDDGMELLGGCCGKNLWNEFYNGQRSLSRHWAREWRALAPTRCEKKLSSLLAALSVAARPCTRERKLIQGESTSTLDSQSRALRGGTS